MNMEEDNVRNQFRGIVPPSSPPPQQQEGIKPTHLLGSAVFNSSEKG